MTDQEMPAAPDPTAQPPETLPVPPPQPPNTIPVPPPPPMQPARRTDLAAIAGVALIVLGIIGGLIGLFVAIVGSSVVTSLRDYLQVPDLEGADAGAIIGGFIAFLGVLVLLYSLVYLLGGIGVLRSASWGRVLGLIVGILSGLVWLSGYSGAAEVSNGSGGIGTLLMLVVHAYIVVVLLFFWKARPSPA